MATRQKLAGLILLQILLTSFHPAVTIATTTPEQQEQTGTCSYPVLMAGPAGSPGNPGPAGSPGIPAVGVQGPQGLSGPSGDPGIPGIPGQSITGSKGSKGDIGQGQSGNKGQKGSRGQRGEDSQVGLAGQPGVPGKVGPSGIKGERGIMGSGGQKGEKGEGQKGQRGTMGSGGQKGQKGIIGSGGQKGQKGEGQKGQRGTMGSGGQKGQKGIIGSGGQKGQKGDSSSHDTSAFTVYRTTGLSVTSGSEVITWDQEAFDIGDDMNHETGIYTCPMSGVYHFSFSLWSHGGYEMDIRLQVNGVNQVRVKNGLGSRHMPQGAGITLMVQAGDEVQLKAYSSTTISETRSKDNFFSGVLLHST